MPTILSGREAASAMRPIGMDEVLEAKIALAASRSTSRTTPCLTERSSNTASITTSAFRMPL